FLCVHRASAVICLFFCLVLPARVLSPILSSYKIRIHPPPSVVTFFGCGSAALGASVVCFLWLRLRGRSKMAVRIIKFLPRAKQGADLRCEPIQIILERTISARA